MTDTKQHGIETGSLQGRVIRPATQAELAQAIELAFDYRGDVTLELTSGERLEGFVYNRTAGGERPALQLFPKRQAGTRDIPYAAIAAVIFSGADPASGKSWEAWMAKKESQRQAEAKQAETEARSRGHL
jgi:hypothetical protein